MRAVYIGILSAASSSGLLFFAFPWPGYSSNVSQDWKGEMLFSYFLVAAVVGLIAAVVVEIVSNVPKRRAILQGVLCGVILIVLLVSGSILMGPYGGDIRGTEVHQFFMEWNFTGFIFQVALPVSVLAGTLNWWAARQRVKTASI
jgi:hypothetical protein